MPGSGWRDGAELRVAYPYDKGRYRGAVDTKVIAGGIANPSNTITFENDLMVTAR